MENKGYRKDIIMQGIARISGGLLSFLAVFILTYLFDEDALGKYNIVLTTINVITSISTLWLSQSILRYYQEKKQIGTLLILTGVCVIISLAFFECYILGSSTKRSIWAYFYVVTLVFYNVFDAIFRKGRKLAYYVGLELLLSIGRLFPMVLLVRITHDFNSIFLSQFITVGLFLLVMFFKEGETLKNAEYKVRKDNLNRYLRFGIPLVGLSISNWFLTSSDRYIIQFLGNDAQVGIYSTNYSLGNSIYMMFSLILINAMHPIIMNLWEKNRQESINVVSNTMELYLIFMSPLVFFGCLKSNILLSMFKGNSYSEHSSVFIWTVLGIFVYGISLLLHKYYECIQKTSYILVINVAAAVFNIIANFILIPVIGFEAAALTTFLSYLLYALVVWIKTHKVFPVKINGNKLVKILGSIAVFYSIDRVLIHSNSVVVFFIEGIIYVLYTAVIYQLLKVCDVKHVLIKTIKGRST